MAIIPNGQQFHTQSADVNTKNKGSAQANSRRKSFTMQDIIDTVGASGGGLAYKQYIVKLTMSGDTLTDIDELYNDTGLTFSWAATGSNNQVNANVTGGALRDEANGIYSWCQTSQEGVGVTLSNGIELFGATVLSFGGVNSLVITGVTVQEEVTTTPETIIDYDAGYNIYLVYNRITI